MLALFWQWTVKWTLFKPLTGSQYCRFSAYHKEERFSLLACLGCKKHALYSIISNQLKAYSLQKNLILIPFWESHQLSKPKKPYPSDIFKSIKMFFSVCSRDLCFIDIYKYIPFIICRLLPRVCSGSIGKKQIVYFRFALVLIFSN